MAGTRRSGPKILWRCYIPADIAVKLESMMADPIRDTTVYGSKSQLVSFLLEEYLAKLEAKAALNQPKQETEINVLD